MTELKSRAINYEKMFIEYQNTNISTNKLQLDNLKLIQGMMKDFYEEEINNSKLINNQLSILLDDMLINEKTFKEAKNKKLLFK